ncbi:MAG TPA: DUF5060 domain-containing protein [Chthonomonadales bacterium]|nr:DUF5060 domain-containing protein [Chthonomonadales bacterium]
MRCSLPWSAVLLVCVAGCGGAPDLGASRTSASAFESGLSGGHARTGAWQRGDAPSGGGPAGRGRYARVEVSFELEGVRGNPFDYTENDVQVSIQRPDGQRMRVPAFFDGGTTWRARWAPDAPGRYTVVNVTLNNTPAEHQKLDRREIEVSGTAGPGFVRIDARTGRFRFEDGSPYFPIGMNTAWGDVPALLAKLGQGGGNWARVWMCHWSGANLDWVMNRRLAVGELDLGVARWWDRVIEAAEKNGIYFQLVLQHHGQYSTRVNPNWSEHPWNRANGGWLATPDEFFSNPRALALTRAKYRYIVARWGASPAVMAWELFNEVQFTDAVANRNLREVQAWHRAMARFLRQHDPYGRLVTSSSDLALTGVFDDMDFLQPHAYASDLVSVITGIDTARLRRPTFFGEVGPDGAGPLEDARYLHQVLWSSVVSTMPGAAQYWAWDRVERAGLFSAFRPAVEFVRRNGLAGRAGARAAATVTTADRGALRFAPAGPWGASRRVQWTVPPGAAPEGLDQMPAFLQGEAHRALFRAAVLRVDYPSDGTFSVRISQVARAGARVVVLVDGAPVAERAWPASGTDRSVSETLTASVVSGRREIRVENRGADWVVVAGFELDPYAPALAVTGRSGNDFAALWLFNRRGAYPGGEGAPVKGARLSVAGLRPGVYRAEWWDTRAGTATASTSATAARDGRIELEVPEVARDIAVAITPAAVTPAAGAAARPSGQRTSPASQRPPQAPPRERSRRDP